MSPATTYAVSIIVVTILCIILLSLGFRRYLKEHEEHFRIKRERMDRKHKKKMAALWREAETLYNFDKVNTLRNAGIYVIEDDDE